MARKILVIAVTVILVLAIVATLIPAAVQHSREAARKAALEQLGAALIEYSDEVKSNRFPPKCREKGVFLPDMDALCKVCPEVTSNKAVMDLLTSRGERPICYLGHVIKDENMLRTLLRKYRQEEADSVRDLREIPTDLDARYNVIHRLQDGAERFFIKEINNPAASPAAQAKLPILWELAKPGKDRIMVCFMEGHVERIDYPSSGIFSTEFMNCLREAMSLPTEPVLETNSPVAEAVRLVVDADRRWADLPGSLLLESCDTTPTIQVKGRQGYLVEFSGGSRIVLFPLSENPAPDIATADIPLEKGLEPRAGYITVDMGTGMGFHWYGRLTFSAQNMLRHDCHLSGGDDPYEVAARGLRYTPRLPSNIRWKYHRMEISERVAALKEICDHPGDARVYAEAYVLLRAEQNAPVSPEILEPFGILEKGLCPYDTTRYEIPSQEVIDEAARRLIAASDEEAVTVAGVAVAVGYCCRSQDILKSLPRERTLALLRHIQRNTGRGKGWIGGQTPERLSAIIKEFESRK